MSSTNIDSRTLLQVLFAVAWTDGEFAESERNFLKALYERFDVGEEVAEWFDRPPETPDWNRLQADEEAAEAVLRQVMVVAAADQNIAYEESWLMDTLRARLGVSEPDFHAIQREVEKDFGAG